MHEQQHARILLVCRANMARSPLAAALLDRALIDAGAPGFEVASAGVQAAEGAPAAHGAVVLAADRGLDLSGHRSRPATTGLVDSSDLVITMSEAHRSTCARLGPGLGARTFTLRELDRLTRRLDPAGAPRAPAARLAWLAESAHLARPSAPPPTGPEDVADPMGHDWPRWDALAEELDALIAPLAARLA